MDRGQSYRVAIIGTGFAGLGLAIQLKKAGIDDFVLLEKASSVGGVWRDNTYPGCACDVPSHLYSFSFEPNPDWSRIYPSQAELQAYLEHCARKYDLARHIRFNTEVTRAELDGTTGLWTVAMKDGSSIKARSFVNGAGSLNRPAMPDIPGLDRFKGKVFHSSQWDHSFELTGKRVAVIGTGASAIQLVPQIAPRVLQLQVYQRTPPWIFPKQDLALSVGWKRVFARVPLVRWLFRTLLYWLHELSAFNFLDKSRRPPLSEREALRYLEKSVQNPELQKALTPDYRIGCKRILLSNDYLQTFNRENVELVTTGIAEITERGILTRDGRERELDAIVFGTGFKATEFLAPLQVRGLDGRELSAEWRNGAPSYLGIMTAGFPNYFMLTGPNTGLGHNSMIFMIEAQVRYIVQCIKKLERAKLCYLDVRNDAQARFTDEVQHKMQNTIWMSGCKSWYLSPDGRNFTLWPGFTFQYWLRTRRVKFDDFELVKESKASEESSRDHDMGYAR